MMLACAAFRATAQNSQPSAATVTASSPAPAAAPVSAGAADILKLLDAGVSTDVIKTYIQTSTAGWNLTAADLVALKQRGVTDEISLELLKHRAAAVDPAPVAAPANSPASRPVVVVRANRLDPEGYDFFQRYYLFPRTLAYANQTLGYGYGYGSYYPYGYARPHRFYGSAYGYPGY